MTDERIAELKRRALDVTDAFTFGDCLRECLDEIETLQQVVTNQAKEYIEGAKQQDAHIRRLREALERTRECYRRGIDGCVCPDCRLLAETEPERGYQPRNPTPLDPMTMKPPAGGSAVVEPRP